MGEARILLRDAPVAAAAEVERKLSVPELLWNDGFVRKTVIILFVAAIWEAYGVALDNPLLFPTLHDTAVTLFDRVKDGTIPMRAWTSLFGRHRAGRDLHGARHLHPHRHRLP